MLVHESGFDSYDRSPTYQPRSHASNAVFSRYFDPATSFQHTARQEGGQRQGTQVRGCMLVLQTCLRVQGEREMRSLEES